MKLLINEQNVEECDATEAKCLHLGRVQKTINLKP